MKFAKSLVLAGLAVASVAAQAQDIRFLTPRNGHWFEVRTGAPAAGRFVPTAPFRVGSVICSGFTDRVSKGEQIRTIVLGSGSALFNLTINGRIAVGTFPVGLTLDVPQRVSPSVFADNIVVNIWQNNRHVWRRVPIGTRP